MPTTAGANVKGIDVPVTAGGEVTGTVKSSAGAVLSGICIQAESESTGNGYYAESAANGTYSIDAVPTGSYTVEFDACGNSKSENWITQYWEDTDNAGDAERVAVTSGKTTAGIDAALVPGAIIEGTVTEGSKVPLTGICVSAYGPVSSGVSPSNSAGTYSIEALAAGTYTVYFATGCGSKSQNWLGQSWKNVTGTGTATPIVLKGGQTVKGINAKMLPGGIISGTVKGVGGGVLAGICVLANPVDEDDAGSIATTASNGTYSLEPLYSGAYSVEFYTGCGSASDDWLTQYWKGAKTEDTSTMVSVTEGKTTPGVSATMQLAGTITGTVTSSTKVPVAGICVQANLANGNSSEEGFSAVTSAAGTFALTGLPTGTYWVQYSPGCGFSGNWLLQWRSGASTLGAAASVPVSNGKTTGGVDATLEPGGQISGKVTGPGGTGLGDICVEADNSSGDYEGSVETGPSGGYTISGLRTGGYDVVFRGCGANYAPVWWGGSAVQSAAKPVAVTAGKTVAGVNQAMVTGGQITGTIKVPSVAGFGTCVAAFSVATGEEVQETFTGISGAFTIVGLASGSYVLGVEGCGATAVGQYYDGADSAKTAKQVSVTAGKTTSGLNMALRADGSISGTVSDAKGALAGVCVEATSTSADFGSQAVSGSSGAYTIHGLPTGHYKVYFVNCGNTGSGTGTSYAPQWYKDRSSAAAANPVAVVDAKTTTGIDATLTAGGTITGQVTRTGGVGEPFVCVTADALSGGTSEYAITGAGGTYTVYDLLPGKYDVSFASNCAGSTFAPQWYKDATVQAKATAVTVSAGKTAAGVSASLVVAGEITGTVKTGSTPLSGVCVGAFYAGSAIEAAFASSAAGGAYDLVGLAPGSYDVEFSPSCLGGNYLTQWWKGSSTQGSAKTVAVVSGKDTAGIDASLKAGGSISGNVKSSSGTDLPFIEVVAFAKGTTTLVSYAETGAGGNYTLAGLPTGSYDVEVNPSDLCDIYAEQYWRDASSQSAATAVTVSVGKTVGGIDAKLSLSSAALDFC